jgi:prepilin-type N-terminal cleavage/methylation domain-containing protein
MRRSSRHPSSRGGFTLVELLVVITIIAIMFALISAAAIKVLSKGDEVKLRNEISQLATAVQAFKQQFAVSYIPDQIILPPYTQSGDSAQVQQLVSETQQFLKSAWTRLSPATLGSANFTLNGTAYTPFTYWGVPGNSRVILQGDQCLVFWLGGPRDAAGNVLAFCADPTDPMNRTSNKRVTLFYEFPTDRLTILPLDSVRTAPFPSFKDIYGTAPYLYFATGKAENAYSHSVALSATSSVLPYQLSSNRFANPSSFQIVSAGKDGLFGAGGLQWAGATGGGATQNGYDDVANFHPTFLGIPAN